MSLIVQWSSSLDSSNTFGVTVRLRLTIDDSSHLKLEVYVNSDALKLTWDSFGLYLLVLIDLVLLPLLP